MTTTVADDTPAHTDELTAAPPTDHGGAAGLLAAGIAASALLSACGGGSDSAATEAATPKIMAQVEHVDAAAVVAAPISDVSASRFLAQASMGANRALIAQVQALGY